MADKKKLSKDVEEQIQSLASDVYIQIEEKLTQLISTSTTDQPAKKINIEEEPAYLSLQNDFNVSQNELAQSLKTQQQLQQDIATQQAKDKKVQAELSKSKVDYAKSLDSLEQENKALKTELTQTQDKISNEQQQLESTLNEQTSQLQTSIEVLSQENNHLKSQLQQKQNNLDEQSELQRSSLADNAQRLNEKQEEISKLTDQLAEFSKQEQSLKEHIEIIEQQRINSDEKLNTSTTTWQENEEQLSATLVEQKQQITDLKNQLISAETDSRVIQDKYNTQIEMANSDFEQKITLLNSELQHAQSESNDQRIKLAEQQEKLTFLEDQIKVHVKTSQDYKQELSLLNDQQTKLKDQQLAEKESRLTKENQLQKIQEEYQQTIAELESKNQSLADGIITEQSEAKLYQKEIESLKSQVKLAQDGQESLHNRFNANREKQERENDQVRETIKYLRDENSEMITQHNEKKEQFLEQIHELESKLTEYRLKFEYAQKQLTQKN